MEIVLEVLSWVGKFALGFMLFEILWQVRNLLRAKATRELTISRARLSEIGQHHEASGIKLPR